jgi:hypothetical protein
VVVVADLARNTPPTPTIMIITITTAIAMVLEIALTCLANRRLDNKQNLALRSAFAFVYLCDLPNAKIPH